MPDKAQLSEEINEVLETNMEFDRMLLDDLKLLHELVHDGTFAEPQVKQFTKKHSKEKLGDEIDSWYPGKIAGKLL